MQTAIPIRNIYYLLCYAWDRYPEGESLDLGQTESPDLRDLLARVLIGGVRRLLSRGLDRGYSEAEEETSALRGRILISQTLRRNLLKKAQVACRFDELRHDIPHNQIIKATMRRLVRFDGLDRSLVEQLHSLIQSFQHVSDIRVSSGVFQRVQLSRNVGHYDLLLKICRLVHESLLPEEEGKGTRFSDVLDDELRMSALFESFVRNFYHLRQNIYSVAIEEIRWHAEAIEKSHLMYLPKMITDITLRSAHRTIVIDTKYYKQTLSQFKGGEKIWSSNLYQLFSYLKNMQSWKTNSDIIVEGLLLYPTVVPVPDLDFVIGGHRIGVRTVDLSQHWKEIDSRLLSIVF